MNGQISEGYLLWFIYLNFWQGTKVFQTPPCWRRDQNTQRHVAEKIEKHLVRYEKNRVEVLEILFQSSGIRTVQIRCGSWFFLCKQHSKNGEIGRSRGMVVKSRHVQVSELELWRIRSTVHSATWLPFKPFRTIVPWGFCSANKPLQHCVLIHELLSQAMWWVSNSVSPRLCNVSGWRNKWVLVDNSCFMRKGHCACLCSFLHW